jgi:hypothetical protein
MSVLKDVTSSAELDGLLKEGVVVCQRYFQLELCA